MTVAVKQRIAGLKMRCLWIQNDIAVTALQSRSFRERADQEPTDCVKELCLYYARMAQHEIRRSWIILQTVLAELAELEAK